MLKRVSLVLLLFSSSAYADLAYTINNTNFTISQGSALENEDKRYLYNYDRFRLRFDYTDANFFATIIADGVNYLGHDYTGSKTFEYLRQVGSDTPFKTQTKFHDYYEGSYYAKLYRLYGGYEDSDNRLVFGLQNISMGVGRIWTPTNLFNPKNIYAIEPDETFGVMALSYTRHLNASSDISFVTSQKADYSFKYAARYKAFLEFSDMGINLISSDETKMIGYELEANLADTGIEIRSEGAYIKNTLKTLGSLQNEEFFQGIIGADYGFKNGLSIVAEALYSSQRFSYERILLNLDSEVLSNLVDSHLSTGVTLSYSFNIFLDASFLYIENFNDKNTRYLSPSLTYTLNDNNAFMIAAMIQEGESPSEAAMQNRYYFKYTFSF